MWKKQPENVSEQKKKGGRTALVAGGVCLVVLAGIAVAVALNRGQDGLSEDDIAAESKTQIDSNVGQGMLVDESYSEPEDDSMEPVLGLYEVTLGGEWEFDSRTYTAENIYVANSEDNVYDMYFDLVERSSEKVLYTSPVIKIGQRLEEKVTLDTDLEPGRYTCTLVHHLLDPETSLEIDGLNLELDIEILPMEAN